MYRYVYPTVSPKLQYMKYTYRDVDRDADIQVYRYTGVQVNMHVQYTGCTRYTDMHGAHTPLTYYTALRNAEAR